MIARTLIFLQTLNTYRNKLNDIFQNILFILFVNLNEIRPYLFIF